MGYFTDPYKWGQPWGDRTHWNPITFAPKTSNVRGVSKVVVREESLNPKIFQKEKSGNAIFWAIYEINP